MRGRGRWSLVLPSPGYYNLIMNPYAAIKCLKCGGLAEKIDADTYQCVNCARTTPTYYPSDWQARRLRVFRRDHFRCVYCGKYGGELHCDHIIPVSEGGSHEECNLRTVCAEDHLARHPEKVVKYLYYYKKSGLSNFHPRQNRAAVRKPHSDTRLFLWLFMALGIVTILCLLQQYL